MTARQEFASKTPDEAKLLVFDFSSDLGAGESVSSASVTCSVWSGTDPAPSSMVSGAVSLASPLVSQLMIGGLTGVIYFVRCLGTTSLGQILPKSGYLAVVATQPG